MSPTSYIFSGRRLFVGAFALSLSAIASCDPAVGNLRDTAEGQESDAGVADAESRAPVSFARDIRPILARGDGPPAGCKRCHYKGQPAAQGVELGGLDLSTLGTLRKGGFTSGARIVVAGNAQASILVQKLEGTYGRGARMPKELPPLPAQEIALVKRWIEEGAVGADTE